MLTLSVVIMMMMILIDRQPMQEAERLFSESNHLKDGSAPGGGIASGQSGETVPAGQVCTLHPGTVAETPGESNSVLSVNRFHSRFSNLPLYQGYGLIAHQVGGGVLLYCDTPQIIYTDVNG